MLGVALLYPIALVGAIVVGWLTVTHGRSGWQVAVRVTLVLYVAWIVGATLFPIPLGGHLSPADLDPTQRLLQRYNAPNIVPLRAIRETAALGWGWPAVRLLAGNVLVFVPFGLLLPAIWPRLARLWPMALAGIAFSAAVELLQLAISLLLGYWYRMGDVDDILLNVAGVLLGYGLSVLIRLARPDPPIRRSSRPGSAPCSPTTRPPTQGRRRCRPASRSCTRPHRRPSWPSSAW